MRVPVEEPVDEYLLDVGLKPYIGDLLGEEAERADGRHVVDPDPLDVVHGEQEGAGDPPVDPRNLHARDVAHVPPETLRVHPVLGEVQLAPDLDRELIHHPRQVVDPQVREERLHPPRKRLQNEDIGLDQVDDTGALHLEGNDLAILHHGPVHLREGGRRDGIGLDDIETFLEVRTVLPDHGPDLLKRERVDPVLQPLQLRYQLGGEKFPPCTHDLAELDVGRPQLLKRKADALVH
ncbi:hypothetical protein DSECCO2_623210 [anaerobic digester metagenome]